MRRPTFGSLFAGIGGIDLGLERAGWECRFQVEWDDFCQRVLAKHWPNVPRYGDISAVDWSGVPPVDLLAGGFPCQPLSIAGKRRAQADDRWLWPEFARAVYELRPRHVLVENVPNLLAVNGGRAFGEVLGDLAALGYDAQWDCVPAAAVGAPHVRDRVWIVASRSQFAGVLADPDNGLVDAFHAIRTGRHVPWDGDPLVAVAGSGERPLGRADRRVGWVMELDEADADGVAAWPDEPPVGRVVDGFPGRLEQLRALGNAVVPQVVEVIGRALMDEVTA